MDLRKKEAQIMNKNERNFWLDWIMLFAFSFTILSGFVLWLAIPRSNTSVFAGIDSAIWLVFHVASGLLGLLGVIIHIVWHWDWLKALRGRSLGTLIGPVRANRLINRLTWIAFIFSNVFGILAWLLSASISPEAIKMFDRFHVATSMAWLVLMATHLVLHQKWIVSAIQRYLPIGLSTTTKSNLGG
jgi:hypothetical protein